MRGFLPVVAVIASVVLGATVFRGEVASAAMQALQVFVTNDAANPVPVAQQGTANVSLANSELTVSLAPATRGGGAASMSASSDVVTGDRSN